MEKVNDVENMTLEYNDSNIEKFKIHVRNVVREIYMVRVHNGELYRGIDNEYGLAYVDNFILDNEKYIVKFFKDFIKMSMINVTNPNKVLVRNYLNLCVYETQTDDKKPCFDYIVLRCENENDNYYIYLTHRNIVDENNTFDTIKTIKFDVIPDTKMVSSFDSDEKNIILIIGFGLLSFVLVYCYIIGFNGTQIY